MAYDIVFNGQNGRKIAYVTAPGPWATLANGTGTIAGSPVTLVTGAQNPAIATAGTFVITLPASCVGTAATNVATVVGGPVTLAPGTNVITVVGAGAITITLSFLPVGGTIANGTTGTIAVSPTALVTGVNTITLTGTGTLVVTLPPGYAGTAVTGGGGAVVTGSPVTLYTGANIITVTLGGANTFTINLVLVAAAVIEIPGIRVIDAVIEASITGGYKVDPAYVTVAGNKVTVQVQYYGNNTIAVPGAAIDVPYATNLLAQTIAVAVIGY
jgi:hypothetical protein